MVNYLYENQTGIWIAATTGLYLANNKGVYRRFTEASEDLPTNCIMYLQEDTTTADQDDFWLATCHDGLVKWHFPSQEETPAHFDHWTTADGLSDNNLYAVYPDQHGYLWLTSNRGLMQFDQSTYQVKTFLEGDGLPHNEFNRSSHYRSKDGTLYFGGLGGLISFHPDQFVENQVNTTPLQLLRMGKWEAGERTLTDQTRQWQNTGGIIIDPSDKFIEVEFALLDFDQQDMHRYHYWIEGYDDHWLPTRGNALNITNLPYGSYTLHIKEQNLRHGLSEQEIKLGIRVLKPFYLQSWFVGLFIGSGLFSIFAVTWKREDRLRKKQEALETEVQNRTQTIAQQTRQLKALDQAKTRFFSNITHEFRTPLTLIIGPLEQLSNEPSTPSLFQRRINGILKNAQHLLVLINQMLDLSKIEGGKMQVEVARGEIVAYTKDLVNRFQPLAQKKKQQLNFITPLDRWEVHFDQGKWDKILYNLLSNAIKFTAHDQVIQVTLLSIYRDREEYIRLDIRDTGIGIEKEHLDQVFNRFYQVDASSTRTQGGTGIGLSLVKELVELQGGDIRVLSEVGKGTSFEICLPLLKAPAESAPLQPHRPESSQITTPALALQRPTTGQQEGEKMAKMELLLIEDNQEMRDYIRFCIDTSKYHITEAADGEAGIQKAQSIIPDLIITDVMMPKKDGFQVTSEIRKNISTSHIPVILLTAKASLESRLEGLQRGADVYLSKPFSPQELALRIEKLIDLRRLLQQRYQKGGALTQEARFQEEDQFILQLRDYILKHLDEVDLSGDRIGRHFAMSRVHLYRKLKALTDQSVSDFVRAIRLKKAEELLIEGRLNVSEVSYRTGFSSIQHFSRTFKKVYGKSPSEFRMISQEKTTRVK